MKKISVLLMALCLSMNICYAFAEDVQPSARVNPSANMKSKTEEKAATPDTKKAAVKAISPKNVKAILQKSDDVMRGNTSQAEYTMVVQSKRWKRTMKMKSWTEGTKKAFILITFPSRDKGATFLKLNNEMWQYIPKIERTIKIPPSMMMQSWMGSDFTNDDLVKESSIVEDYTGKILSQDNESWKIELIPKPDAAVAWDKVIIWINKKTYLPMKEEFYDEDGELVRVMNFSNVLKTGNRFYASKMEMIPKTEDKEGNITTVYIKNMVFDQPIRKGLFSLGSLKSMSR